MDLKEVRKLLQLMKTHGLSEIEIENSDGRVRLKKNGQPETVVQPILAAAPMPAQVQVPANGAAAPEPEPPPDQDDGLHKITSPMVGTFYHSSTPGGEAFVKAGDKVTEDTVICIIEAMKVMNEIKAEIEGEVVAVHVDNGEPVEYGHLLFSIRTTGK